MKPNHRIYLVGHGVEMRLVSAAHRAQALSHVARSLINVKVASQHELVAALGKGITIESCSDAETIDLFEDKTEPAKVAA